MLNQEAILGLVRHVLTIGGTYAVTKGVFDQGTADTVIGAVLVLGATGWSVFAKKVPPAA